MLVDSSANRVTIISYYTPWDNSYNSETECPLFTLSFYYLTIISPLSHYYLTIIRPIISTYMLLSVSILLSTIILPIMHYYLTSDILYSLSLEMCAKFASAFAHQSGICARFDDCTLSSTKICASGHAWRHTVWPYSNVFVLDYYVHYFNYYQCSLFPLAERP